MAKYSIHPTLRDTYIMLRAVVVLVLCGSSLAAGPEQWIPLRWPAGAPLDLLAGTPVNCILVNLSNGADVKTYAAEARRKGISVLGIVPAGADVELAAKAAIEASLDGLVSEGNIPGLDKLRRRIPVIRLAPREKLYADTASPVLAIGDALWLRVKRISDSGAPAGPTGDPWLDSNVWRIRSLAPEDRKQPIWTGEIPDQPLPDDYPRAVAEAAMAGGRWIIAFDDQTQQGLLRGQPEALAVWRKTMTHVRFYQDHAEWARFAPRARIAVVHDPSSKNAFMSGEVLNLLTRRQMPYRVIERRSLTVSGLSNLDAVVAIDVDPPTPVERKLLVVFAEAGGLVLAAPAWNPQSSASGRAYALESVGRGRVAVYKQPPSDPFAVSLDLLTLVGRNNVGLRLFNGSSVLSHLSRDPSTKRILLQLVNYADAPVERITARIRGDFRTATLLTPDGPPASLPLETATETVEMTIPRVSISAAVLLQ